MFHLRTKSKKIKPVKGARTIIHLDMDSYFATVEQQANPFLRGKPIAVTGGPGKRVIAVAASVEAKKKGAKTGMPIHMIKEFCPELICVPLDFSKYSSVTKQFLGIFRRFTPEIEIFSIDEAFMDITKTQDRFGGAVKIASNLKDIIHNEIGEWVNCSIGIAPNKSLAKLASNYNKPNGLTEVRPGDEAEFLAEHNLTDICGIAKRIEARLERLGIKTLADLGATPRGVLIKEFGVYGSYLKRVGQGTDNSPVLPYYYTAAEKSFGHQYTLPKSTFDIQTLDNITLWLAEKVGRRLRNKHFKFKTVHFGVRYDNYSGFHQQKTLTSHSDNSYDIYELAMDIFHSHELRSVVRCVYVAACNLVKTRQLYLFPDDQRKARLVKAGDKINNRYGDFTLKRAKFLQLDGRQNDLHLRGCALQKRFKF